MTIRKINSKQIARLMGCEASYVLMQISRHPDFPPKLLYGGTSTTPYWDYHAVKHWIERVAGQTIVIVKGIKER